MSRHGQKARDIYVLRNTLPWLVAATVPLAYLTKSLKIPLAYLMIGLYWALYDNLLEKPEACVFCRPTMRDLHAVNQEATISIGELHKRRTAILTRLNAPNLQTLDDLERALDLEIKSLS